MSRRPTYAVGAPEDAIILGKNVSTMDIGRTQLFNAKPRHRLDAGSFGTMGVGMGFVITAALVHPDKSIVSVSGDSAIGFSGMEMETVCPYQLPVKIVVFNNGGIGPEHAEPPDNALQNMKPNALIYGARYDKMMEACGGKGFFIENPKDLKSASFISTQIAIPYSSGRAVNRQARSGMLRHAAGGNAK